MHAAEQMQREAIRLQQAGKTHGAEAGVQTHGGFGAAAALPTAQRRRRRAASPSAPSVSASRPSEAGAGTAATSV